MIPLAPLAALLLAAAAPNDTATEHSPRYPRISVQVDPVLFALRGYSVWLGVAVAPHWNLTIGSFAGDVPGQPEGWAARTRFAPIVLASYFFLEGNRGPHLSLGFGQLQWVLTHQDEPGATAEMDQVVFTPMAGFRWFPLKDLGLYLEPFISIAIPIFQTGETTLRDKTYRQPWTSLLLPGAFLGWEF